LALMAAVLDRLPAHRLAGHFHDTSGHALYNIKVGLARGLRVFDASVGGLGGCPFAPGAKGNVATEAAVAMINAMGFETGINVDRLSDVAKFAESLRSRSE
jgi:hydroxymethylglutaryl-CoA lyase